MAPRTASCKCLSHNDFLTLAGYAWTAAHPGDDVGMFPWSDLCYLDKVSSVSALVDGDGDEHATQSEPQLERQLELRLFLQLEIF